MRKLGGRDPEASEAAWELSAVAQTLEAARHPLGNYLSALARSRLGQGDIAVELMRRHVDAVKPVGDYLRRWRVETDLAVLYAYLGRKGECVEAVAKLLRQPSGLTVPMLGVDPAWDHVREDPAFKALLADPQNSAPL